MAKADRDRDGRIDGAEFLAYFHKLTGGLNADDFDFMWYRLMRSIEHVHFMMEANRAQIRYRRMMENQLAAEDIQALPAPSPPSPRKGEPWSAAAHCVASRAEATLLPAPTSCVPPFAKPLGRVLDPLGSLGCTTVAHTSTAIAQPAPAHALCAASRADEQTGPLGQRQCAHAHTGAPHQQNRIQPTRVQQHPIPICEPGTKTPTGVHRQRMGFGYDNETHARTNLSSRHPLPTKSHDT